MLFDTLDKLKRNSIFSAILLTALGAIILICPESHIPLIVLSYGYVLVILALVMILDFLSSDKTLMAYVKFVGALVLGIVGICALVFRNDTIRVLTWLFGFLLTLDGARTMFHSFTYSRRSGRKNWWILTLLSALLIAAGVILSINPVWDTPARLMKAIGCAVLFSAVGSIFRLFFTWPLKKSKGGNEDGKD